MTPLPLGILALSGVVAGGGFDLLETTTLTSSASSVTFSGLDAYSDYKHLQIRMTGRVDNTTAYNLYHMRLNGDSGSSYSRHALIGTGSVVDPSGASTQTLMGVGVAPGSSVTSNVFNAAVIDILDFSSSKNTTVRSLSGSAGGGLDSISLLSSAWYNTTAVTSIEIFRASYNFISGSRFSLIGVK